MIAFPVHISSCCSYTSDTSDVHVNTPLFVLVFTVACAPLNFKVHGNYETICKPNYSSRMGSM